MSPKQPAKKSAKRPAKKAAAKPRKPVPAPEPTLYHRLHAVLHSVRTIAHFEDSLCILLEHVKTAGTADAELTQELADLVEKLPSELYLHDLEALRATLPAITPKPPAKAAKRATPKRTR